MNINSVKLVNDGLKGVIVTYAQPYQKNGVTFLDEYPGVKKKAPVHFEMSELFESLAEYLLNISGYHISTRKQDLLDTTITGITYNNKGFIIVGKKKVLSGDKTINLVTPLLNEESYPDFDEVAEIMSKIYEEVKEYMLGNKSMTDEQLVLKFNEGKDDFDEEAFNQMNDVEKRDFATKILEGMGAIVLHSEDMEGMEATVVISRDDVRGEEEIEGSEVPIAPYESIVEVATSPAKEEDNFELPPVNFKPAPLKVVNGENGEFKVVANEERVSTAARKKQA